MLIPINVDIYVDEQKVTSVSKGKFARFTVKNGKHTIYAKAAATSKRLDFTAASNEIIFTAKLNMLSLDLAQTGDKPLAQTDTKPPDSAQAPDSSRASRRQARSPQDTVSLENALADAADSIIESLEDDSTIAVIGISSRDREMGEFVLDELSFILVDSGYFNVVDRKSLDAVRSEQSFQNSGEVEDDSAVEIGKMLGATIVITGSISGSGTMRRLTLKALDVKTARIVSMARESF
ncbi:MAG: CsgG/HfaB family protein [Treponema sp.]|nr:CsgG/HfaB family protein [Treponema sp.]